MILLYLPGMKLLLLALSAMISSLFSGCGAQAAPPFCDNNPVSYEYTYDVCMANPARWYRVFTDEGGNLCLAYNAGGFEATILRAPADILQTIGKTVREKKLYNLQRSYTPPFQVLDGYSWHIDIEYEGGSIWSGGSNAHPEKDLDEAIDAINEYLEGIIASASEDDVIGRKPYRDVRG